MTGICQDLDDRRDRMDAWVGGIEDYLGFSVGEVQSIVLWDGQNVDLIIRGAECQARDECRTQEYAQELLELAYFTDHR